MSDREKLVWITSELRPTSSDVPVIDFYHEYGTHPSDSMIERTLDFAGAPAPPKVVIRSHVVSSGMRALSSPEYLATVRRRQSRKIAKLVENLAHRQDSDEFVVWTHEVLDELRRVIGKISDAEQFAMPEHEGNSCEVLRLIRDSMLGNGWRRLREANVRQMFASKLSMLATAAEITADNVDQTFQQLMELGLNPSVGLGLPDVEEEKKVSG